MEKKQTQNRSLISLLILIFVVIGAILVLTEIYNNVSERLDEKKFNMSQLSGTVLTENRGAVWFL